MSVEGMSSLLMTSSPGGSYTVPVDHLDYTYIQQCGDLKYLEKILHVLRSGIEGVYPHLTEFCEKHIETLDLTHRALRKDMCPATAASFSADEWKDISDDLETWQREITETEQRLKQSLIFTHPPVHNRTLQIPRNTTATTTHSNQCTVINSAHTHLPQNIDTAALTQQEKCVLATREREKGNEAFRARDWDEAIVYYSRSLCILPTVAGFNNRAQAEIKLQRWTDALRDCDAVLHIETHNCKGFLRRATVFTHQGKLQAAYDDITTVLQCEPQNITAQKLLQEVNKKNTGMQHNTGSPNLPSSGKKLLVQEVNEEKEEERSESEIAGVDKHAQTNLAGLTDRETERQMEIKTDGELERQTERQTSGVRQGVDTAAVRREGNELYRSGQYGDAAEKYTHGITTLTQSDVYSEEDMFVLYCNRAACFLKMGQCSECVSDCCQALPLKPFSVKALLRRAVAFETLEKFQLAYVDYRTVQQIHNTHSIQQHVNRLSQVLMEQDGPDWKTKLPEVPFVPISAHHDGTETQPTSQTTPNTHTVATMKTSPNTEIPPTVKTPPTIQCQTTMEPRHIETPPISGPSQTRRRIKIIEVEGDADEDEDSKDDIKISSPANAFEFGQALNAACCRGDLATCARLLRTLSPQTIPHYISTQLDTHTLSFIIHTLHTHILPTEPGLVYHLLTHLHTTYRFTVVLMLMDSDERRQITQLFERLCMVECDEFTHEDLKSLANKFS